MDGNTESKNVLLIGSTMNYMLNSIKSQLQLKQLQVIFREGTMDRVSRAGKDYRAVLIYADELILAEQQLLVYIKDLATEEDLPVFIMGYPDELELIKTVIPSHLIAGEFTRPINVGQLAMSISDYFENHEVGNFKKILVVDDSGAALRMIKGWLCKKYQVILANSGMMAIKYLTQDNPDLILLDYEMPICDGKQVLEMIRSESEYSNVPVIFLTAKGDRESILKVMALKPDGYLLKSMDPAMIVKNIDEFFEKNKANI